MYFAIAAITFGLAAGIKPGPLGVFVIHQTLSRGLLNGFLSSLAPIITDGPIILVAMMVTLQLDELSWFISLISIFGGVYLAYIAYRMFKVPNHINPNSTNGHQRSLLTAVKINALNPAPYLFWLTIGSGYLMMGSRLDAVVFIVCALTSLCITKFLVAVSIKKLGDHFSPKTYALIIRSLSVPLLVFSAQLLYSGISIWF